ncbi:MAG: lipopolysaccharide biosynthesis protein [Bryobacteraceae bacterium]
MAATTVTAPRCRPLSWQWNLAWTSLGTVVYAASNWAMLSAIAKLGTPEMVGEFALGLAVTAPVLLLAQMNLRAVLATDTKEEYRFRDYRALRVNATVAGIVAIAAIAWASYGAKTALVVMAVGLAQAIEGVSDIYYGLMQQHERMDRITISQFWRGPLGLVAMAVGVGLTGSVLWGAAALMAVRVAVLAVYDAGAGTRDFLAREAARAGVPDARGRAGARLDRAQGARPIGPQVTNLPHRWRQGLTRQFSIFWLAAPLSSVMLLNSLSTNMPRYFIEHHSGTRELGLFSAAASLVAVGNTIINALGQAVTPKLAKMFAWEGASKFARFSGRLAAFGAALGVCAIGCSVLLGRWVLTLMFRPEYAAQAGLLTSLMVAGAIGYIATLMGYAVTAARSFRPQLPVFVAVTLVTLAGCAIWIPARGLAGAAIATGVSSAVQLAGLGYLVWRVIARAKRAEASLGCSCGASVRAAAEAESPC